MKPYLKCGMQGCDHREAIDELSPALIDKPCPKCGDNLLSEADYLAGLAFIEMHRNMERDNALWVIDLLLENRAGASVEVGVGGGVVALTRSGAV